MRFKLNFLLSVFLILFSITLTLAGTPSEAAASALSVKLKKDLALEKVTVRLSQVQTFHVSKSLIGLKGNGKANDLEISFEVKLSKAKLIPTEVEYQFLEPNLSSPFSDEVLTRDLLSELNKDFKTDNLVVAVDSFNTEAIADHKMKITGNGEVRIDFEWKKVKFEMVKDEKSTSPVTVKYQIY